MATQHRSVRARRDAADDAAPAVFAPASGPSPRPVTARGEATRRRILDAAEAVFGEMGYYEASVSEITRRAGVAQGTFYIYFRTKRDIFAELVEDLGHRLRQATRRASAAAPARAEAERLGFRAFFAFVAEHRQLYRIVQEAERVVPDAAHHYYERICQGYMRGLGEAMLAGEVPIMDAEAIAYALMGIGHFVALRWLIWPEAPAGADGSRGVNETSRARGARDQVPAVVLDSVLAFIARGLGGA